jgi:hypothetical protein
MENETWYADTAYDSRKKKDVPPPDPNAWRGKERALRAHPLPLGVYCGNYRADLSRTTILELQKGLPKGRLTHEFGELYTLANPKIVIATFRWLGGVFSAIGLFVFFFAKEDKFTLSDWESYIFFLMPFLTPHKGVLFLVPML